MANRVLLITLVLASASASAQTTPTTIVTPTEAPVAPWIEQRGNLRLSIACGDLGAAAPDDGLEVRIDGTPLDPQQVTERGAGYVVMPGHHHVQLSVPGCAPSEFELDADPMHSTHVDGRLVLDDWWLAGTAGSPNGYGFTAGAWFEPTPGGAAGDSVFDQTDSYDGGHTAGGAYISVSRERRFFLTATDVTLAGGSTSGAVTSGGTSQPFTASVFANRDQFRIGGRLPLHFASLAAGTGIGFEWWITSGHFSSNESTQSFAPNGPDATFYFPMWASATIKATCEWGVQALAQYDVHPSAMDSNGVSLGAGIIYQPSAACSDAPGVSVTAD